MARSERLVLLAILLFCGVAWGLSIPLGKIAVTHGYRDFGIIFWQFTVGSVLLGAANLIRGKSLPLTRAPVIFYVVIALVGTLLPNWASYTAAIHLPAGIIAILIALVPMFAFPIALALRNDSFSKRRFLGLAIGLTAIWMIVGPEASLPDPAMVLFVPLGLVAPFLYACEANFVSLKQPEGLDAIQVLLGGSLVGMVFSLPLALATGEWIDPRPPYVLADFAVVASACLHASAYSCYVYIVSRGGAVFAAQVSYLVTGAAVIWSGLLLGESYSIWVWGAFVLMFLGLFLVQPRPKQTLAVAPVLGDDGA